jgi:hypothetical protein
MVACFRVRAADGALRLLRHEAAAPAWFLLEPAGRGSERADYRRCLR